MISHKGTLHKSRSGQNELKVNKNKLRTIRTRDTRFVSRSSQPKVLRLHWGRIQETTLKNPYAPHPRSRSPLKPKVTYYEFLGEEWRLQTSRGAQTREDAPRTTPNRLEASFKSNKRELTFGDDSSALEMGMAALKVRCSSSHSNLALTQDLAQILTRFSSIKVWGLEFKP